jgi:hypothetical protein
MANEHTVTSAIENPTTVVLPAGILQQDADIIDDQENHTVLTLRIPKQVIRSNRALLSALIEMAAADDDALAKAAAEAQ